MQTTFSSKVGRTIIKTNYYLEVSASWVHPRCANTHNCLGTTLERWWNTKVKFDVPYTLHLPKPPRLLLKKCFLKPQVWLLCKSGYNSEIVFYWSFSPQKPSINHWKSFQKVDLVITIILWGYYSRAAFIQKLILELWIFGFRQLFKSGS